MVTTAHTDAVSVTARRRAGLPWQRFDIELEVQEQSGQQMSAPGETEQLLQAAVAAVQARLEGGVLEEAIGAEPSVERTAMWVYRLCQGLVPGLSAVAVSPEPGCRAEYRPSKFTVASSAAADH